MSGDVNLIKSFESEVVLGRVSGITAETVIGCAPDVDTVDVPMTLWCATVKGYYPWMAVAAPLEVVSDSAADTSAGTGAQKVFIEVLDADYVKSEIVITLNGLTPVPIGTWFRVNRLRTEVVGSAGGNVGTINVRRVTGGLIQQSLRAGMGQAFSAIYTIPKGYTGLGVQVRHNMIREAVTANAITVENRDRLFPNGWIYRNAVQVSTSANLEDTTFFQYPTRLPSTTDIEFVITNVTANNTAIRCRVQFVLVKE